jgi:hypothetical protein
MVMEEVINSSTKDHRRSMVMVSLMDTDSLVPMDNLVLTDSKALTVSKLMGNQGNMVILRVQVATLDRHLIKDGKCCALAD